MKLFFLLTMVMWSNPSTVSIVEVAFDVKQYFRSVCAYILHSEKIGMKESTYVSQIRKHLQKTQVYVATLAPSKIHEPFKEIHSCKNRPLYIVPQYHRKLQDILKEFTSLDLSSAIWLLILSKKVHIQTFFNDTNIPFDCEFLVAQPEDDLSLVLTEVYRVGPTLPLQTYRFGNWTPGGGLTWPSQGFYQRRNNLQGLVLKTGTVNIQGGVLTITKEINNKPEEVGGYFGDIWRALEETLNFRSDYYKPRNNLMGAERNNKTWGGLIGMMVTGDVDVTNMGLLWNTLRASFVDFLTPISRQRMCLFVRLPDPTELVWNSFLKPFSSGIWVAMILTMTLLATAFSVTNKAWNLCRNKMGEAETNISFIEFLHYTFSAFCQQEIYWNHNFRSWQDPDTFFQPHIYLTTYLIAVVMMTSYSASLISFIMTEVYRLPFNSFQEFLDDGTYQLGMLADSASLTHFKMSNISMLREIYRKQIAPYESSLPTTFLELLERACSNRNYAVMMFDDIVTALSKRINCTLQKVPNTHLERTLAMATQKKSPYRGILKLTTNNMHRNGLLQIFFERNYPERKTEIHSDFSSVLLEEVTPILVVLTAGVTAAILLLIIERLLKWMAGKLRE